MISKPKNPKKKTKKKNLVIIDETPECRRAVAFAAQHAQNTNRTLVLLCVVDSTEFQHFLGVNNIMRTESTQSAHKILGDIASDVRTSHALETEIVVREGKKIDEISKLIDEDKRIALIVLAASGHTEGPGPLIQLIGNKGTAFSIPVIVIPSNLADEDIRSIA
ncbi:universal stress protein [Bartonella tribocorum]|uniref:UspA protein homolog n=1 Tax=Bartonella tribocorum (strain DSM 28219 / CCUG 45778 / CIP 105476 / IBS 506) TaxID=382640 RepID=A9IWR0_BART1|nr:universal stress protein [Bartonella tribocorum]CAK02024.1 UspA protein homolog [Bartonella tribocorum CIP 105476]CDO49289.1 putative universal stress protein UspA [Bartonella tribocorum]